MDVVGEGERLFGSPIKSLVYCRLGCGLKRKFQSRLRKGRASGFKFSDLVQISKRDCLISFGTNQKWAENKNRNAARRTLKEILSAPFTFVTQRLFPFSTCERLAGKRYGRASENFKVTRAIRGSEIPPCFPTARRTQRTVELVTQAIKPVQSTHHHLPR